MVDEESNDLNFALQNDLDGVYDGLNADKYFYGQKARQSFDFTVGNKTFDSS